MFFFNNKISHFLTRIYNVLMSIIYKAKDKVSSYPTVLELYLLKTFRNSYIRDAVLKIRTVLGLNNDTMKLLLRPINSHLGKYFQFSYVLFKDYTIVGCKYLNLRSTKFFFLCKKLIKRLSYLVVGVMWRSFSFGFHYIQGLVFLLFIDACLSDDEPLWEPIEWSLVQTWILFIFIFSWIAENLITSRYGSYTGRDKRVWMGWYKTFWLIEIWFLTNFLAAAVFVIVPFYFETNYSLSFIYTWWHWYSRVFFFKFISLFSIVVTISYLLQTSLRWLNWRKVLVVVAIINIFMSYLLYTHFIMSFFGYFTNPLWYQKNRPIDYIQLSHEPSKWGYGVAKRDHFTYHGTRTVFWFKNDGPLASSFLLFHLYIFLSFFFVYMYWIALFRRIYSMKEVPLTYTIYCVSALKQLFYCFLCLYFFIFLSFVIQYWRLPVELFYGIENESWFSNILVIFLDYPTFLISIIK